MKTIAALSFALLAAAELSAATIYVDNVKGNDSNDGSKERPVASIEKGLTPLPRSEREKSGCQSRRHTGTAAGSQR